ncbi:MAG: response regulator [Caldithrix sp.]|nr:response regulator [Caldithrix sp.]
MSKKTIVIADDDIDLLEQLRMQLEAKNFEVEAFESQTEVEQYIEEHEPDLAILDLMMENQDSGFVLSYKIKKLYPHVPVILITGVTSETGIKFDAATDEMRSWIKADIMLDKDIRFEQLEKEINRLLPDRYE